MILLTRLIIATVLTAVIGGQAFADDIHISLFPNTPGEVRIHGKTVDYSNDTDDGFSFANYSDDDLSVRVVPKDQHNDRKFKDLIEFLKGQPGDSFPGYFKRDRQRRLNVNYKLRGNQLMVEVDGVNYYISKRFREADSGDTDDGPGDLDDE